MLHITKPNERCCGTCQYWNGCRVVEEDGFVYSMAAAEATCSHLWETGKDDPHCHPLTLSYTGGCADWSRWEAISAPAKIPDRRPSPRSEGLWQAAGLFSSPPIP